MSIQFDPNKAIYAQIVDSFYQQICSAELMPGEKLPSVRETAQTLKVNPNTVSRAYQEMDRDQVTYSKRGQGTFVTEDLAIIRTLKEALAKKQLTELVHYMRKLGYTDETMIEALTKIVKEV
ncbi:MULTISPECIES: GntR family transcriptional regulator [Shouchella]|uniref:GntR family transcriptional regulator n=2 Tax=Shouchella TaxID=2893057 RepID=A0ABY7W1F3_9BACI|nr:MULTISPECIES: GntR family transcriptional regulator [Shouchella]MED4129515.1 GntR family transcriptional regulator [Shouchella miscanthi]WDF02780.1 GntR family transcriptional regulator [Shouchella hunanensis]GAF23235.1 transcriptional regulator, GntR family [Bacillus sp. JCM 19047]